MVNKIKSRHSSSFTHTSIFLLCLIYFSTIATGGAQSPKAPAETEYLYQLNIPSDWTVKRQIEGKDYTLTAFTKDETFYLYYVQFMEDEEERPEDYLQTYLSQFAMDSISREVVSKTVKGKLYTIYLANGNGSFGEEKFKMMTIATAIQKKNIAAYVIYPLNADQEMKEKVKNVLVGEIPK
jgi:hypothetical protein